jgi:hypothetical protein
MLLFDAFERANGSKDVACFSLFAAGQARRAEYGAVADGLWRGRSGKGSAGMGAAASLVSLDRKIEKRR